MTSFPVMYSSLGSWNSHNQKYDEKEEARKRKYSEISHFSHKEHKLRLEYEEESPFKCDGCKELGIGWRYSCSSLCDFDLHTHCATPSSSLFHPFYPKCSFHFLSHPPGDTPRYCNACQKHVTGFLYHCFSCGFDLHPCCAKLPTVLDQTGLTLLLYRKLSSPCHRCGQKGRGWSYRSSCKTYNLHVACVSDIVFETWHEGRSFNTLLHTTCHKGRPSKGTSSRVTKYCQVAGIALQAVVSAVLGDPTALIAGIMGSLISRG
ncbi:hypothetical protein Fmac_001874 [Flemingia macrophylla]|uniref:DC1 domain-containing protein n=1 Tax=Flemingia macrophylla TaxID=520843 RepID=A0ABD1NIB8_9FABA